MFKNLLHPSISMNKNFLKKTFLTLLFFVPLLFGVVRVLAITSSWTQQTIPSHGFLNYMASSADGSTLVLGVNGGGSLIWVGTGCGSIGQCGAWTSQTATSTIGVTMSSVAIDAAGDKMVAVAVSGDVYVGTACSGGLCTWTDQGSGPGSHGWQEVSMSSDGSIISVDGSGTDVWIGTACTGGTCTWHDQGTTPGSQNWRTMAMSSDGSKIATALFSGDIFIGTGCSLGTCTTWNDQGTGTSEPGVQSWRSLSFSADGSELAGAVTGGHVWIGTGCTSGTCSAWTDQGTPAAGSYAVALSADGTKLASSMLGGDIWLGYNCNTGLCTWTDQGTSTFGGTQNWRSIASDSTGTKLAALNQSGIPGPNGIWTGVITYPPTVTTGIATSIQTTVTLDGNITNTGGSNPTVEGINYGLTTGYGSVASTTGMFSTGAYTENIGGLTCNTTYNYQAFATNSIGTATGTNAIFTTSPCASTVTTDAPSILTANSVTLGGNITATGGANATSRGINYGLTAGYGSTSSADNGSFGAGAFTEQINGLVCGTTYHYQAFATNSGGTGDGADTTFTTNPCSHSGGVINVLPSGLNTEPSDFTIDGGASTTASPSLTITMNADPHTVSGYSISLDPTFTNAVIITPYTSTTTFTLPTTPKTYTLYLKYVSTTGNDSAVLSRTITYTLDTTTASSTTFFTPTNTIATTNTQIVSTTNNTQNLPISSFAFTRTLKLGSTGPDVKALQQFLNSQGFIISTVPGGPGSPGNETGILGRATRSALIKFLNQAVVISGTGNFLPVIENDAEIGKYAVILSQGPSPETKEEIAAEQATTRTYEGYAYFQSVLQ